MPLSITVSNPRPTYTSGSTITGTIAFTSSTPTTFQDIRISFIGVSKSKISKAKGAGAPSAAYRAKCVLVEKERILFTANDSFLPPGEYKYPFEFTFPEIVQEGRKWVEKSPYRSDANQPLPPCFAFEGADEERNLICNIEYRLEAQVTRPGKGLFTSRTPLIKEGTKLDFLPEHAISDAHQNEEIYRHQKDQLFNIRGALLLPENRGRSLSMSERFQGWLLPSQLPRFSFTATFSYPTRVIRGSPLNCFLEITPHMEDSSVVSEPEIILQSIYIYVISRTSARAAPSLMGSLSAEIEGKVDILSSTSLHLPVSGQINFSDILGPLALRHMDVSFRTFNIAQTYRLCADMVFSCAGKSNLFKVCGENFEVVGESLKEMKEVSFDRDRVIAAEEALPTYTLLDQGPFGRL
ncbi:uncharacterized protein BDV14DRAFT_195351 [Aspergillus stella-maris]|uniref:uncharacterized protein n=1 Tax=Aspergillus stella-maris TaxID=1810926 RepID=UPI003CCCAD97